jgi:hypothetical protein
MYRHGKRAVVTRKKSVQDLEGKSRINYTRISNRKLSCSKENNSLKVVLGRKAGAPS